MAWAKPSAHLSLITMTVTEPVHSEDPLGLLLELQDEAFIPPAVFELEALKLEPPRAHKRPDLGIA